MSRNDHQSSIEIDNEYSGDGPTLVIKCECNWKHVVMREYDRYAGYKYRVTMEQLWAIWMQHLGGTR